MTWDDLISSLGQVRLAEQIASINLHAGIHDFLSVPFGNDLGIGSDRDLRRLIVSRNPQRQTPSDVVVNSLGRDDTISGGNSNNHKSHQLFITAESVFPVEENSHKMIWVRWIAIFKDVSTIGTVEHAATLLDRHHRDIN